MRRSAPAPCGILRRISAGALLAGIVVGLAGGPAAATSRPAPPRRVLLLALPTMSWSEVRDHRLPNLESLLGRSGIANLMLRSTSRNTDPGDGYATIGAGTRTTGSGQDGEILGADEPYAGADGAELYERRTGTPLGTAIGAIGQPALVAANEALLFQSVPGDLGSTLRTAGWRRAAIANADTGETTPADQRLHREAALVLTDRSGRLPGGVVDDRLLRRRPDAPFGLALRSSAVLDSFDAAWRDRTVVLVEASDLARADAYRHLASPEERDRQRRAALRRTDRLIGALLARVDARRDLVVAFGAYHPSYARNLGILAVRAPGVEPGYVESSTTRRPGYVALQDIAPTVLDRLDIEVPEAMEGRPIHSSGRTTSTFDDRVDRLARETHASQFRDATIGTAMVALAVTVVLVALLGLVVLLVPRAARWRRPYVGVCLAVPGFMAATFLTEPFGFHRIGAGAYWVVVVLIAVAFGALTAATRRVHWLLPTALATGALVALHGIDALLGAHLQFATVFGYSPTVGVRVAGLGNPASAQLSASALILATILVGWLGPRRGIPVSAALLGAVLLIVAAPPWGQDFGGALSNAPAYALFLWLAAGRRVTRRAVAWLTLSLVGAGLAVGFLDLLRPRASRTHVGRFFEKVGHEGFAGFITVIGRKADLMLQTFLVPTWVLASIGLLALLALLAWGTPWLRRLADALPSVRAGGWAFAVMAVLGLLLNDSGVTVPGMMLAVLVPCLLALTVLQPAADPGRSRADEPPEARSGSRGGPGEPVGAGPA